MSVDAFDRYAADYDRWYGEHRGTYLAELEVLRRLMPGGGSGIEIGAGTGRFGRALGVTLAIEPSRQMATLAHARGVRTVQAVGEQLPLADGLLDYALLVTVLCFLADPVAVLRETARVLKPGAMVLVAIIDRHSDLGRVYEARRDADRFYRHARFYDTDAVLDMLAQAGFEQPRTYQTILGSADGAVSDEPPVRPGYGEGAFVGIAAVLGHAAPRPA